MARKVFISVLGTGFYYKGKYSKGSFISDETRFIQQATLQNIIQGGDWGRNDSVMILLTDHARKFNWDVDSDQRINIRSNEPEAYDGLKKVLTDMKLEACIEDVNIPNGSDEKEMWEIFDIIYNRLQEGDELYFDLTHAFRYLPMLILILGYYSKFLKHTTIKSITYGNFEARDKETNVSPIIDLLPLATLQEWIDAASSFIDNGDAKRLNGLCSKEVTPILKETKGKDQIASNIRNLINELSSFTEEIKFCRGKETIKGVSSGKVRELSENIENTFIKPFNPLIDVIKSTTESFCKSDARNCIKAAGLCMKYEQYQAATTFMQEGIISFLCAKYGLDLYDKDDRDLVNRAFQRGREDYKPCGNEEKVDEILEDELLKDESFKKTYKGFSETRNDINHAGMRVNSTSPQTLRKKVQEMYDDIVAIISTDENAKVEEPEKPKMLINLSNHPYTEWNDCQKQAATQYGECADMKYPSIDPFCDEEQIDETVNRLIGQILELNKTKELTVHVMGESGSQFLIVSQLMQYGITCIYSTSYRIVDTDKDGVKHVKFDFKRFRQYGK